MGRGETARHGPTVAPGDITRNRVPDILGGGSYDWLWLLTPDGKEVGPIGEDEASFREMYVPPRR